MSQQDILLEQLVDAPRPFPLQPSPMMAPSDHNSSISYTLVEGKRVSCFVTGGEPKVCFPQVLHQCLSGIDPNEVSRVIADLEIHLPEASQRQIDSLKYTKAIPNHIVQCGLIKKSDAERLIGELKAASHGHEAPLGLDENERLGIKHDCFGGNKGFLYPSLYPKPCIRCIDCDLFFIPDRFTTHNHGRKEIRRTCHWGFNPSNWRLYFRLTKAYRSIPGTQEALQEFNYPKTKKRSGEEMEKPQVPEKRSLTVVDYEAALKSEQLRKNELLHQLGVLEKMAFDKNLPACIPNLQQLQPFLQFSAITGIPLKPIEEAKVVSSGEGTSKVVVVNDLLIGGKAGVQEKEEDLTIDVDGEAADVILTDETRKPLPSGGASDGGCQEDELDALLAAHLHDPNVLQAVRAHIARTERDINEKWQKACNERDSLAVENRHLKDSVDLLIKLIHPKDFATMLQQQQQHQQLQQMQQLQHKQLVAAALQLPSLFQSPAAKPIQLPSASSAVVNLPNSLLLQQLQQAVAQQNPFNISSQLALAAFPGGLDLSQFNNILAMGNPSKHMQLPTASQMDQLSGHRLQ